MTECFQIMECFQIDGIKVISAITLGEIEVLSTASSEYQLLEQYEKTNKVQLTILSSVSFKFSSNSKISSF